MNAGFKEITPGTNPPQRIFAASPYLSTRDPFNENTKYKDRKKFKDNPASKKFGFGSSDFPKRDEFSNSFRTEQWRETLKKDKRNLEKRQRERQQNRPQSVQERPPVKPRQGRRLEHASLYDRIHANTESNFKYAKDSAWHNINVKPKGVPKDTPVIIQVDGRKYLVTPPSRRGRPASAFA